MTKKKVSKSRRKPRAPRKADFDDESHLGFRVGERVSMHPVTDAFMMGDRYGEVSKLGKKLVYVKMDKSGKTRIVSPGYLEHI
jgi:hypothetical protein